MSTRGLRDIRGIEVVGDPQAFAGSLERMREFVAGSFPVDASATFAELELSIAALTGGRDTEASFARLEAVLRQPREDLQGSASMGVVLELPTRKENA